MKAWKIAAIAAGGVVAAAGAIVAYDHFCGGKKLTRPYGVVVGKSIREDGAYILVRRFKNVYEIKVDEETCNAIKNKSLYDLSNYLASRNDEQVSVEELLDVAAEPVAEVDAPAHTNPEEEVILDAKTEE